MSLVKCPSCGGQISDTSGRCVHCGFAFKICPECGAVLAKGAPRCTECGKQFEEDNVAEPPKQEQDSPKRETTAATKFGGYEDEFIQQQPRYRDKIPKTVGRVTTVVDILFLAVALILIIILSIKEGEDQLAFLESANRPILAFFILSILIDMMEYLFKKWWQFAKDTAFQAWCRREKEGEIRGLSPEEYRAIVEENGIPRASAILHDYECPEGKKVDLFDVIGKCVLRIATDVALIVGLVQIMEKALFSASPQASWIYINVSLICALCFFGARILFWFLTYYIYRKRWLKWLTSARQRAEKNADGK